jgi:hypothetical protein
VAVKIGCATPAQASFRGHVHHLAIFLGQGVGMNWVPQPSRKPTPIKSRCNRCRGSGRAGCSICGGSGQVATGRSVFGAQHYGVCPGCFGLKESRCTSCGGEGFR